MILVCSAPIYTCKCKQLNNTKRANNHSTAVHILGPEGKGLIFSEKGKIRVKKGKKDKKNRAKIHKRMEKNRDIFYQFLKRALSYLRLSPV